MIPSPVRAGLYFAFCRIGRTAKAACAVVLTLSIPVWPASWVLDSGFSGYGLLAEAFPVFQGLLLGFPKLKMHRLSSCTLAFPLLPSGNWSDFERSNTIPHHVYTLYSFCILLLPHNFLPGITVLIPLPNECLVVHKAENRRRALDGCFNIKKRLSSHLLLLPVLGPCSI